MPTASYHRALAEAAPLDVIVDALEIAHSALTTPVRAVNDVRRRVIEEHTYQPVAFRATLLSDEEGRAASAAIEIDNVGRTLTRWIEASQGGVGATVRVMQVRLPPADAPSIVEWTVTLGVLAVHMDQHRVSVRLGYASLLDRPAVAMRYDLRTAPGLF